MENSERSEPLCRLGLSSTLPYSLPLGLCHAHTPVSPAEQDRREVIIYLGTSQAENTQTLCLGSRTLQVCSLLRRGDRWLDSGQLGREGRQLGRIEISVN